MSETKFTPGPWRYSEAHGDIVSMAGIADDIVCDSASSDHPKYFVRGRDAHLIAAAPDLYAAVENLIAAITPLHNAHFQIERECISDKDVEDAQAAVRAAEIALAKARGENQ